jgi:hypothetical protein
VSQRGSEPSPPEGDDRVVAISRATLRGVDFRKARFDRFSLAGCLFLSCDFRGLRLDKRYQPMFSAQPHSIFRDCRFDGTDLRRVKPDQARFERCTFDDALLDGWRTDLAEFVGCRFAGAMGRVTFFGRPAGAAARRVDAQRKRNEFSGNDFRDADLDSVIFIGVDLAAQRLPVGDRYVRLDRFPQRIAHARAEIVRWEIQEERLLALAMLRDLSTRWRDQGEIIEPRMRGGGPPARLQTRVWDVLERAIG